MKPMTKFFEMLEVTNLSKDLWQVEVFLNTFISESERSQSEIEELIQNSRNQLHELYDQITELKILLEGKEQQNLELEIKLEQALKDRDELVTKVSTTQQELSNEKEDIINKMIEINKTLQQEKEDLERELEKQEVNFELFQQSCNKADEIFEENNKLKMDNEALNIEVKKLIQISDKLKSEFVKNVDAFGLMKQELAELKKFKEENVQCKINSVEYCSDIENLLKKYKCLQEEIENNSEDLKLMSIKLNEQHACFEVNKKLIEEKRDLIIEITNNNIYIEQLEVDLKENDLSLNNAICEINQRDKEISALKDELEFEKLHVKEIKQLSEKNIAATHNECNIYKKQLDDVAIQLSQHNEIYMERQDAMYEMQNSLTFYNIQYEIDVEYLKGVIRNQKNLILNLQDQVAELVKHHERSEIVTKDAEVMATEKVLTADASVLAIIADENKGDKIELEEDKFGDNLITKAVIDKVINQIESYKERNQNPCDGEDLKKANNIDPQLRKFLKLIDSKISCLLTEVKVFYETSISDLHKKYKVEAERQLSYSETSLAKLKHCYEKNLKHIKREHDEKVIRLLSAHEEEVRHMSLYQQNIHSIKEKLVKGKKERKKNL